MKHEKKKEHKKEESKGKKEKGSMTPAPKKMGGGLSGDIKKGKSSVEKY